MQHITLNTGHSRDSHRAEVRDDIIETLGPLLVQACSGDIVEGVPVPGTRGYSFTARCAGDCMTASVYADGPPAQLLCSFAVAGSECGRTVWPVMHQLDFDVALATDPNSVPDPPWCAVLLTRACIVHAQALSWLGDFERCLAWTYLEVQHE